MIAFPAGVKVWIAGVVTDMRPMVRGGHEHAGVAGAAGDRAGPYAGEIFCFRGRKGDLVKILWHDG
jgi:transposase